MMTATKAYVPTDEDLAWAQRTLALLAHGGLWLYPRTAATFRYDAPERRLVCIDPGLLTPELWRCTHATFDQLGVTVTEPSPAGHA